MDVVFGEFCGSTEVSLAKCRSAAAAPAFYERDFESERFEYLHGSNARFTFDGHSGVQPLQERQLLSAASSSSDFNGSCPFVRNSSAARMMFARPRVDITSSCVAINVGHMMPLCLRQPPQPLHCSRLPTNDRSLNANASTG